MAQEEDSELGGYKPTLADVTYSALNLPESDGRDLYVRILLEETLATLERLGVLSGDELGGVLSRTQERINVWAERTKRSMSEAAKEKGYPPDFADEMLDRMKESADASLLCARERLLKKPDE